MRRFFLILFSIVITFVLLYPQARASEVKVLKKGESAPFDGVLFTKEMEKSIRMDIQLSEKKVETLNKLNELNEKEIEILSKRLEIHQNKNREFADREVEYENSTFWKHTLYFISGALITGLISYGIHR